MNIDDLKNSFQSLSYKGDDMVNLEFTRRVESVVEKVRKEDRRDKLMLVGAGIMLGAFAIIYAIIGVLKYVDAPDSTAWWGYGLYVLAIISALPIIRYKYRKIGSSDYNAPVTKFISDVEKKFAFFPKEYAIAMIPFMLLTDASAVYLFAGSNKPNLQNILEAQIPIVAGLAIGLIIAAILWYTQKLPILEELRAIKANISE